MLPILHNTHVFTLAELLLALSIAVLTVGVVYAIYVHQVKSQIVQEDIIAMYQDVRAAWDLLVSEIRMAGYDPRGVNRDHDSLNNFDGIHAEGKELHLQADLNGNGRLTDANERIVYVFDEKTNTLRRRTGRGGRQSVVENIQSFKFELLNRQGQGARSPSEIRLVAFSITGQTAHRDKTYPENNGYRTFTLRSRVVPRNLLGS